MQSVRCNMRQPTRRLLLQRAVCWRSLHRLWIGLVQLCLSRRKVKDRDCHEIWAKLRGSSCLCAALLAVAACGCLLRQGWLLAAGYAMDALLAYAMYRKIKGLTFSLLPGDGSTFTED